MSCQDATDMIGRVKATESVNEIIKIEIVETVKEATPQCNWDAHG